MLLTFFSCRVLLFPYLYYAYSRYLNATRTEVQSCALPARRVTVIVSVFQVRLRPAAHGAPRGPLAVQPGGRPAVAPAAVLVHADLQRGAPSVRRQALGCLQRWLHRHIGRCEWGPASRPRKCQQAGCRWNRQSNFQSMSNQYISSFHPQNIKNICSPAPSLCFSVKATLRNVGGAFNPHVKCFLFPCG